MLERNVVSVMTHSMLVAAAALVLAASVDAQPSEPAVDTAVPGGVAADAEGAAEANAAAEDAPAAFVLPRDGVEEAGAAGLELVDEDDLPQGIEPLATYVVADEITVRGTRPGDIRQRLWDLDLEIERTVVSFFRQLNEVIVDPQYHVRCVMAPQRSPFPGVRSRIMERRCYAGFQMDELESMSAAQAGGGAYEPSQHWLLRKEQEYAEIVMTAIAEIPSLAMAAEELVRMQEERYVLTGGEPALSYSEMERRDARARILAQYERRDARRERQAEREAEREARREADAD